MTIYQSPVHLQAVESSGDLYSFDMVKSKLFV